MVEAAGRLGPGARVAYAAALLAGVHITPVAGASRG